MIFGDTTIFLDRDGYSTKDYPSGNRSQPEYERKMAIVRMSSSDFNAITTYEIANSNLLKTPNKGDFDYYTSLFEKSLSTSRIVTAKIDDESLSSHLRCISTSNGKMLAVTPKHINVVIREAHDESNRSIYGSSFFFSDKRDKDHEDIEIIEKNDTLSIDVYLNKESFSAIFDELKNDTNNIHMVFKLIAYQDWIYSTTGVGSPTHIINPENESNENFAMLTSISLSTHDITDKKESYTPESELVLDDLIEDKKEVMLSEILTSLNSLSYTAKSMFYFLCFIAMLLVFSILR